jgi:hypothetical protein
MSQFENPLENVRIASPCSADWNEMYGDDRSRFCGQCRLNVYNLSGMTRYDAENLLRLSEGRLCVRYYQRPDGTIMTKDCPVGWARIKERVSVMAAAVFALVVSLFGGLFLVSSFTRKTIVKEFRLPLTEPTPQPLMGAVALKPRPGQTSTRN